MSKPTGKARRRPLNIYVLLIEKEQKLCDKYDKILGSKIKELNILSRRISSIIKKQNTDSLDCEYYINFILRCFIVKIVMSLVHGLLIFKINQICLLVS